MSYELISLISTGIQNNHLLKSQRHIHTFLSSINTPVTNAFILIQSDIEVNSSKIKDKIIDNTSKDVAER